MVVSSALILSRVSRNRGLRVSGTAHIAVDSTQPTKATIEIQLASRTEIVAITREKEKIPCVVEMKG